MISLTTSDLEVEEFAEELTDDAKGVESEERTSTELPNFFLLLFDFSELLLPLYLKYLLKLRISLTLSRIPAV